MEMEKAKMERRFLRGSSTFNHGVKTLNLQRIMLSPCATNSKEVKDQTIQGARRSLCN
jgi:hypothetical protein